MPRQLSRPGLDPGNYHFGSVLDLEVARIFRKAWQFVGLASELAQPNDFVTSKIAGQCVVVQNFAGELRAFLNVCSHRQAILQTAERGNRALVCPYHNWTFDRDGVPVGIPRNSDSFGFDWEDRTQSALAPVELARCGNLVFVRLEPGGPPLDEFLGSFEAPLAAASEFFIDLFDRGSVIWKANWKIAVESAIEGYHVGPIHAQSFQPLVGKTNATQHADPHSFAATDLSGEGQDSMTRYATRLGLPRLPATGQYEHFHIFPNMMGIISGGTVFGMQTYEPLDAGTTRLHYWGTLGSSTKPAQRRGSVRKAVEKQLIEFNQLVLAEDQAISESVQSGRRQTKAPAILGKLEDRIVAFHQVWSRAMGAAGDAP